MNQLAHARITAANAITHNKLGKHKHRKLKPNVFDPTQDPYQGNIKIWKIRRIV